MPILPVEIWENGKKTESLPCPSRLYADEEVNSLNRRFDWTRYVPKIIASSLGKAELEELAKRLLTFAHLCHGWCGVSEEEFKALINNDWESHYVDEMVESGFFRRKNLAGTIVIFPTGKLLENQEVSNHPF